MSGFAFFPACGGKEGRVLTPRLKSCAKRFPMLLLSCLLPLSAHAASSDEIQVYTDSINQPGAVGLELHTNFVVEGDRFPAYQGDIPSQHLLRVTPEFSYGLSKFLEAGLYLPAARGEDGSIYLDGWRTRLKFLSKFADDRFFVGLNCEYGRVSKRLEESNWNLELRPIVGFRSYPWLVSFNPVLGWKLSGVERASPTFSPELKLQYAVTEKVGVGIEHYTELGEITHMLPLSEQGQVLYAVLDITKVFLPINLGIGRRLTAASDEWVIKAIFNVSLSALF